MEGVGWFRVGVDEKSVEEKRREEKRREEKGLAYRLGVARNLSVGQISLTQSPAYRHTQTISSRSRSRSGVLCHRRSLPHGSAAATGGERRRRRAKRRVQPTEESRRDRLRGACARTRTRAAPRRRFARKLILRETPGYEGASSEEPGSADRAHTAQGVVRIVRLARHTSSDPPLAHHHSLSPPVGATTILSSTHRAADAAIM